MDDGLIETYLHYQHIAKAINETRDINPSNLRCVCVLLNKHRLVAMGVNKHKTHPIIKTLGYNIYRRRYPLHAEVDAWLKTRKKKEKFDTMMVYRGADANLPSCPCDVCSKWIKKLKVKVVYTSVIGIAVAHSEKLVGHVKEDCLVDTIIT